VGTGDAVLVLFSSAQAITAPPLVAGGLHRQPTPEALSPDFPDDRFVSMQRPLPSSLGIGSIRTLDQ